MIARLNPNYQLADLARFFVPASENYLEQLSELFIEHTGHPSAFPFRYGRSGLYFLLKALGAKNKKVIMPAYTCVVVAHAVRLSGNVPVFLDNAPNKFQPNPEDYLSAIDKDTVMIIPTHLFGIAEETSELYRKVKALHPEVFVLQDCAHSFFCCDSTGVVVTEYGDGGLFGMNISKLVNSIRGGMLTLRDVHLSKEILRAKRCSSSFRGASSHLKLNDMTHPGKMTSTFRSLKARMYGLSAAVAFTPLGYEVTRFLVDHSGLLDSEVKYFDPGTIELPRDFSAPMLSVEAAVGVASLRRWKDRVGQRRKIANAYLELLKEFVPYGVVVPTFNPGNTWSHFPVLVPKQRESLRTRLEKELNTEIGIIVDYSIPDLPSYQSPQNASCLNARGAAAAVLNLPMTFFEGLHPTGKKNFDRFLKIISNCFREAYCD